MVDRDRLQVTI